MFESAKEVLGQLKGGARSVCKESTKSQPADERESDVGLKEIGGEKMETKEKVAFFDQEDKELIEATANKDVLEKIKEYTYQDLTEIQVDRSMKVKVEQFVPCMCTVTKSHSAKTGNVFYTMEVHYSSPLKHKMSSDAFNENVYNQLIMEADFSIKEAVLSFPVRMRFIKGYSEESLSPDKSFYAMQVLVPTNAERKMLLFDYITGTEKYLINTASKKTKEECEVKGINYFSGRGFKLYRTDSRSVKVPKNFFEGYNQEFGETE